MNVRDFSDSVKLEVIKKNLSHNNGNIQCVACGKKMTSIEECHFDHIFPYAKGGKSSEDNCQILCADCNLKKNDKLFEDFMLEEKAKAFLAGKTTISNNVSEDDPLPNTASKESHKNVSENMSKEQFDNVIGDYIAKNGNIQKIDFAREYNHLPSFTYVNKYYGGLKELKEAFGVPDISFYWNRDTIKEALVRFVHEHGSLTQKDMCKANGLPSMTCILRYYPEYKSLTDVQKKLLGLDVQKVWDKESAKQAGIEFMKSHASINQKDFIAKNQLPSYGVMKQLYGSLNAYQREIGAPISKRNELISKEEVHQAVNDFFGGADRIIENQNMFSKSFRIKPEIIRKRYGSFDNFCAEEEITVLNPKKNKYTKREVDDVISNWVLKGEGIPKVHDLTKVGLPSANVIMRFYKDWREPFIMYQKLHEEVNRVK